VLTQKMLKTSLLLIHEFKPAKQRDIAYIELVVDNVQTEITQYLWNVSCNQLTPVLSKKLFTFSSIVYDIERIGDRSTNIVELAESKHKRNAVFSGPAIAELKEIGDLVMKNLDDAVMLIEQRDGKKIQDVFERHLQVVVAIKAATEKHLVRFYEKVCHAEAGPIFVDMLVNLERISDHCQIIAEHIKPGDLVVNATEPKKLTNHRASGSDDASRIAPKTLMTLEECMEYIQQDECIEVTPKNIRMRKVVLDENERNRISKSMKSEAV
jgi:predicted membrane GTPase involved in stress response